MFYSFFFSSFFSPFFLLVAPHPQPQPQLGLLLIVGSGVVGFCGLNLLCMGVGEEVAVIVAAW